MRAPNFMQGVTSKPTAPANFTRTAPPTPPTPALMVVPHDPLPSPPLPPAPIGFPVALAELRPPPSPPRPAFMNDDAIAHAIESLKLQNERLAELARSDALEVGFLVAEKILEQEIAGNPRVLMNLVRSAMRRLAESRQITVQVSAGDHERLNTRLKNGAADAATLAGVKLEVDPSLSAGDCRVSSELGVVDGRMSTRLTELRRSIDAAEEGGD